MIELSLPISIVMPVYNARPFLCKAVNSILSQSYSNFELVIRDDGSTDGSSDDLRKLMEKDERIKVFRSDRNEGPAESSNSAVRLSQYGIVARMDADDISHPDRIRRELAVLSARPEAVMVGSLFEGIDAQGNTIRSRDRSRLLRPEESPPMAHGSIMFRRSAFEQVGGYRSQCNFWEDQDLFLRLSRLGEILIIPKTLYYYRFNYKGTRIVSVRQGVERNIDLGQRCFEEFIRSGDYESVLQSGDAAPPGPRAIRAIGELELWSNIRPLLIKRLWVSLSNDPSPRHIGFFLWGCWARLSPGTLRWVSRIWAYARDRIASQVVDDGKIYVWGTDTAYSLPDEVTENDDSKRDTSSEKYHGA